MSGILLPGQGRRPNPETPESTSGASGSGLILPSSAGRRSEPTPAPTPPAPDAAGPDAAPDAARIIGSESDLEGIGAPEGQGGSGGAAQPAAARRRLNPEDLLFPPTGAQVQCPSCGTPFTVPIFSIIDLGANPELKQLLLGGQINVASCPRCGAGGALSAPLMVHVPEKQWLGVITPAEARITEVQRQKVIGEMTQTLMRKLPQDQRKGYMLQPRQYMDWTRFLEQLWEFEGITADMLRRQRAQSELVESLLSLADDRDALAIAVNRNIDLIDRAFFNILDRMYLMLANQPSADGQLIMSRFGALRVALLEMTPAGQEMADLQARVQELAAKFRPGIQREELLQALVEAFDQPDGREIVAAVTLASAPAFDYEFMLRIAERIEQTSGDERAHLEELRTMVLSAQERLQENSQAAAQQASQLLQELLQADNLEDALRANAEDLDETFLAVLAGSIQQAERNKSVAAARRLRQVYDMALQILQEDMPPELQLMNLLLSVAERRADLKRVREENRDALTPDFIAALHRIEDEMRDEGRSELADRVKSIRGQAALMM